MNLINRKDELFSNAGWVIRAKLLLVGSLMVIFALSHFFGFLKFPLFPFFIATTLEISINLPHHWLMRKIKNPEWVFNVTSAMDVAIITVAANTLGDLGKFLALLLYPLVFIFAGVVMSPNKTYFYANQGFFMLAALTGLEYRGIIPVNESLMIDFSGGERLAILLIVFPIYNFIAYFVKYLADLFRKREEQLVDNAFRDELTGLSSRYVLMERLGQAVKRAESLVDYSFAVLFLDLDRFKLVNNSLGYAIGDELLMETARRLQRCVKSYDTVARLGGDEYAILLEYIHGVDDVGRVASRIQKELSGAISLSGHDVFTTASIGIAISGNQYHSAEEILQDAHTAMYKAKASGKARYETYSAEMRPPVLERLELETDLRRALDRGEFRLWYQPVISLDSQELVGLEALIRWAHPVRGLVAPADFIPVAEEIGLISQIGWWVMQEACTQLKNWQRQFNGRFHLTLSINLSGEQCKQPNLSAGVRRILEETGIDPHNLKFEITETVLIGSAESILDEISRLKDLNIQLYMDDFGTGYSSLSYLRRFNIDKLKIDRSFVSRLDTSERDQQIVRTIVTLAHSLNMGVIAEGVENPGQLMILKGMGCDFGQGYHFAKPLDLHDTDALIQDSFKFSRRKRREAS
ncbi:MAG: bifunctional diguanylate cyclase/phosphodiesterase [Candidatus Omnitrophica bacterium]|nr:bifunctional diguanylate cyclase/phosphodiesterase [Candidatus Omnitrophota bacterium]